jgi:hypothetical protein
MLLSLILELGFNTKHKFCLYSTPKLSLQIYQPIVFTIFRDIFLDRGVGIAAPYPNMRLPLTLPFT